MTLSEYLKQPHVNRPEFAKKIGVSSSYLSQLSTGWRPCGLCYAIRIEDASGGEVSIRDMARKPDNKG